MRKADNLATFMCRLSINYRKLKLLEPCSGLQWDSNPSCSTLSSLRISTCWPVAFPVSCFSSDVGSAGFGLLRKLHLGTGSCWPHCTFKLFTQIFTISLLHNTYIYPSLLLHASAMNFCHLQGTRNVFELDYAAHISFYFPRYVLVFVGSNSSAAVATRYGLDGPGIQPRLRREFPHPSRPILGPTQPPRQ